jgi:O-antigen ligase
LTQGSPGGATSQAPHPSAPPSPLDGLPFGLGLAMASAVVLPTLLILPIPPSSTVLNQAMAWLGWGVAACLLAWRPVTSQRAPGAASLLAALAVVALSALCAPLWAGVPWTLALSTAGTVAAAAVVAAAGARAAAGGMLMPAFTAVCLGLLLAGAANVGIGLVQVYLPSLVDGELIASAGGSGRAAGNLRQTNHLASLLVWSAVAVVWAAEAAIVRRGVAWALLAAMVVGLVLTASRTGVLCVGLLAVWGALDKRLLSRGARAMLLALPLLYAIAWAVLTALAEPGTVGFGGGARVSNLQDTSRLVTWTQTLELIRGHPWAGVGVNAFNFAWTLTPFPERHFEYFDHCHNLVLQLLVELGLPLGVLVLALLGAAGVRAWRAAARVEEQARQALAVRAAFVMVASIGIHSLLEYPLWYAYFLLPTAFLLGLCVGAGSGAAARGAATTRTLLVPRLAAASLVLGGLVIVVDYTRAADVFLPDDARPLEERIAAGRASWLFGHHADYALATVSRRPERVLDAFDRPVYYLLDARLMWAWARALATAGDIERARHVAQRLREFRRDDAQALFDGCAQTAGAASRPFQCDAPARAVTPADLRPR